MRTRRLGYVPDHDLFMPFAVGKHIGFSAGGFRLPAPIQAHLHSGYEFGVVLKGRQKRQYDGYSFVTDAGDVWLIGEWEPHAWTSLPPGVSNVSVHITEAFLGEVEILGRPWQHLFITPPSQRPRILTAEGRTRAQAIGEELRDELLAQRIGWEEMARLSTLRLFTIVLRDWWGEGRSLLEPAAVAQSAIRVTAAFQLIAKSRTYDIAISQAAAACELSRSQFCRLFQQATGVSFGRFQNRARLRAVGGYLLHSGRTIDTIAQETGFASASHLHRMFNKYYGCTPSEFRERNRRSASP